MSFPRYPKYKSSGVEWLGDVPEHWEICALKRIVSMQSGESITADDIEEVGDFPVFGGNGLRGFTTSFTHEGHYVLVGRQGALCGNINFSNGKFWASEHAVVASPTIPVETFWLGETMRAMNLNQYSVSAAQPGISVELVGGIRTVVPPFVEQTRIAAFLEQETLKIDALVAEQRRLMELLKEKRQAVISHAVTRGLNPAAPLKPSGIEWLGDVPEHWEVNKIKHLLAVGIEQGWSPQCEGYPAEAVGEWGVLKVGCVNGGRFRAMENKLLPPEMEPIQALSLKRQDLLISRANTRELVGSAAVVEKDHPTLMLCDKLYRLRFRPEDGHPPFVSNYLGSSVVRGQIELGATGASDSMLNIGQSTILELVIATPPLVEQCEIVAYIYGELLRLDTLTAESQHAIDLLQERRTALISAAVTGQIDVRGFVEAEAA